jgi:hypothetical protein
MAAAAVVVASKGRTIIEYCVPGLKKFFGFFSSTS